MTALGEAERLGILLERAEGEGQLRRDREARGPSGDSTRGIGTGAWGIGDRGEGLPRRRRGRKPASRTVAKSGQLRTRSRFARMRRHGPAGRCGRDCDPGGPRGKAQVPAVTERDAGGEFAADRPGGSGQVAHGLPGRPGVSEDGAVNVAEEDRPRPDAALDAHEGEPVVEVGHEHRGALPFVRRQAAQQADGALSQRERC